MPAITRKPGHAALAALTVTLAALAVVAGAVAAQTPDGHKRLVVDGTVTSPDGKGVAYLTHLVPRDRPVESIRVASVGGTTRILYRSAASCCTGLAWLSRTRLVFDDDYRVTTLDVTTGRIQPIAGFSDFTVSPDHRWIAGWADSGGHIPQSVGVVSADGSGCRVVPTPAHHTDLNASFTANGALHVLRSPFLFRKGSAGAGRWLTLNLAQLPLAAPGACFS